MKANKDRFREISNMFHEPYLTKIFEKLWRLELMMERFLKFVISFASYNN